ncbi:hypothetical protein HN799_00045, partial [Candidatus Woesearchaeota archaeon]|nr:hypothetical protein [Candidatus Woesearchaeota archaeon]
MKDVGSGINSYLHKSNSNYEKTFHEKSFFEEEEEESTDKEYKTLTGRQQSIIKQQMTSGSSTLEETKELKKISARLRELEGEEGDV